VATSAVSISASGGERNAAEPTMKQTSLDPKQSVYLLTLPDLLRRLRGGLIVSCQAEADEPLYGSENMAAMATATNEGGAAGIRANTPKDSASIRHPVTLTSIGIYKMNLLGYTVCVPIEQAGYEAVNQLTYLTRGEKTKCTNCFAD